MSNNPESTKGSLAKALIQYPPRNPPLPKQGHLPAQILLKIFGQPCPRDVLKLTHVCQFWRNLLVNGTPQMWRTIDTRDSRSFVELCLERSKDSPLQVSVTVSEHEIIHPRCTCDRDSQGRLVPSQSKPCQYHFVFESLADTKHASRICVLTLIFCNLPDDAARLGLGSCLFFVSCFPQLINLEWRDFSLGETQFNDHLFDIPPFLHTLRSLTLEGSKSWHGQLTQLKRLTCLTSLDLILQTIDAESFRTFMLSNPSLERISLFSLTLEGSTDGPPAQLSKVKYLKVDLLQVPDTKLTTLFRVPALQRLSSLFISVTDEFNQSLTVRANGEAIEFSLISHFDHITDAWEDLTGYARPTIYHVHLQGFSEWFPFWESFGRAVIAWLVDANTLEVGYSYSAWSTYFWLDLKQVGPQLKTIRFEVREEMEPDQFSTEYYKYGGEVLDKIEDLMKYRFEQGRPFSSVERLVVRGDDRINRQEAYVWRCFYHGRHLDRYVRIE